MSALDEKILVGGVFCDLQRVFDCVNHNILLTKLEFYGISGTALQLLRSYLNNRHQRVTIKDSNNNKQTSEWELIKHRIPQGSILGPLPFLIYINDLARTINKVAEVILFADDMSIIISNKNIQEFKNNLNSVIKQTINWFQSNLLSLNYNKTYFLKFFTEKKTK